MEGQSESSESVKIHVRLEHNNSSAGWFAKTDLYVLTASLKTTSGRHEYGGEGVKVRQSNHPYRGRPHGGSVSLSRFVLPLSVLRRLLLCSRKLRFHH